MLSVGKLGRTKLGHYHLKELEKYRSGRGENPHVRWIGKGSERIGLIGQWVAVQVVMNLLKGFDSTGKVKWVQNAGRFRQHNWNRMPGFDLSFSVPKSLSYIWSICLPSLRAKIEEALLESVLSTMIQVEELAFIRIGKGGQLHIPAGLVALVMMHFTARPVKGQRPDPQLHVHVLLINTGIAENGKTGALHGVKFLNKSEREQFAKKYGVTFRRDLSPRIETLGFGIEPTLINGEEGWEVAGIPDLELRRNSKRAKQIQQAAKEKNTPARRQVILTREAKYEIEPSELFPIWEREAWERGITPDIIENLRTQHHEHELTQQRELEREQEIERGREGLEPDFFDR